MRKSVILHNAQYGKNPEITLQENPPATFIIIPTDEWWLQLPPWPSLPPAGEKLLVWSTSQPGTEEFCYVGMMERAFKIRFYEHTSNFNHRDNGDHPNLHTSPSKKVWDFKDQRPHYTVTWKMLRRGNSYRPGQKSCVLSLSEKLEILKHSSDHRLLNT